MDLTADHPAITAMAARLVANLFKFKRFDDRDKFADGAF